MFGRFSGEKYTSRWEGIWSSKVTLSIGWEYWFEATDSKGNDPLSPSATEGNKGADFFKVGVGNNGFLEGSGTELTLFGFSLDLTEQSSFGIGEGGTDLTTFLGASSESGFFLPLFFSFFDFCFCACDWGKMVRDEALLELDSSPAGLTLLWWLISLGLFLMHGSLTLVLLLYSTKSIFLHIGLSW